MPILSPTSLYVLQHPGSFALRIVKDFSRNQGLLLAGAVAYYALLSIIPLLILMLMALTQIVDQAELLRTLGRYLEWLVPSQSQAIVTELAHFLDSRGVIGWVLLVTMLFFSSLGFSVLDKAMAVIFRHQETGRKRHALVSVLLPYCYILVISFGLLLVTLVSTGLQLMDQESIELFGYSLSLRGFSPVLLYLFGLAGEVFVLTSVYWVMPAGSVPLRRALIGGVSAALLWELTRHLLVWYFANLSQASVVYGSLTTSIIILLSLEVAATLLLFGAQVIAEYERVGRQLAADTGAG